MNELFKFERNDGSISTNQTAENGKKSFSGANFEFAFAKRRSNVQAKPIVTKNQTTYSMSIKKEFTSVKDYSDIDFSKRVATERKAEEKPIQEEKVATTDVKKVQQNHQIDNLIDEEIACVIYRAKAGMLFD